MKRKVFFIFLLFGALAYTFCYAGTGKPWDISVKKISDKVIVLSSWGVNVGAIATEKGIVVIDAHNSPAIAGDIRRVIEKEFGRTDIKYLINTHHHMDNTGGNQIFADAKIIALKCCPDEMRKDNEMFGQFIAEGKDRIKMIEMEITNYKGSDPNERKRLEEKKDFVERMYDDLEKNYKMTLPNETIGEQVSMDMGDMTLKLYCFQKCHSPSDLLILIPEQNIAFTGDLNDKIWLSEAYEQNRPAWLTKLNTILKENGKFKYVISAHDPNPSPEMTEYRKIMTFPLESYKNKKSAAYTLSNVLYSQDFNSALNEYNKMKSDDQSYYFNNIQLLDVLNQLFDQDKDESALKLIDILVNDLKESFTNDGDLESLINSRGIKLLRERKTDEALSYFKINMKCYPNSWNVYDSYGEGLLAKGDTVLALRNYMKSLNINPSSKHACNVLKRFKPDWINENPTEFTKITDNVYKTSYTCNVFPNTLIYNGSDAVLLVDPGQIGVATKLQGEMIKVASGKVKYIINTHAHADHAGGNEVFCCSKNTVNMQNLQQNIERGLIFKGKKPLRGLNDKTIANYYLMPFNNEEIILIPEYGLHSENDLVVYFPKSGVACLGDLLVSESFPSISADVKKYTDFLETILSVFPEETKFVSGHGKIYTYEDLKKYSKTIDETIKLVIDEIRQGKDIEQIHPETILSRCSMGKDFLKADRDNWIRNVYYSELR
jgi:cyclase